MCLRRGRGEGKMAAQERPRNGVVEGHSSGSRIDHQLVSHARDLMVCLTWGRFSPRDTGQGEAPA